MARKISITQDIIKNAGFELAKEEGISAVTARRLADKAGCSTQPIFRIYDKMDQLHEDIFEMAIHYFSEFYESEKQKEKISDKPFVQFGLLYIEFASASPRLFEMLFLSKNRYGRSLYELLNGSTGAFVREMNQAKAEGVRDPGSLFMKMWIFIHGAACMTLTGDYDLPREETIRLLLDMYEKNAH
ncbi:MAG: TetR/AcrR family transcriptional regulator [Lachnospiraceae bacterium]|nr:TetR/AcrR family transcriptional regulator [Lachnospiraceae bacterium]